jgi:hypothetical protein
VCTWDAMTPSMSRTAAPFAAPATATATASARAKPRQVPVPRRCAHCCSRCPPLVRVDDTIEWVRPDVMKMVLYFNWSPNADDEAQVPWEV